MLAPALCGIGSAATAIVCTRNGLRGQVRQKTASLAIFTGEGGAARMEKKRFGFDISSFWLPSLFPFQCGSIVKQRNGASYKMRQFL